MRLLRRCAYYGFTLLYLIVCPLTILYALGYDIQPKAERGLVKTGLISLSSIPHRASVYVGRRRYAQRTPAVLPKLLPGTYPIRVALKGHQPWARQVRVEAGKATTFEHLLLLPDPLAPQRLLPGPFEDFAQVGRRTLLLVRRDRRLGQVALYDLRDRDAEALVPEDSPWGRTKLLAWFAQPESDDLLLRVSPSERPRWLWTEGVASSPRARRLRQLGARMPASPDRVAWEPGELFAREALLALDAGVLLRVPMDPEAAPARLATGARGFGVANRAVYVVTQEQSLVRMDSRGRNREVLEDAPAFRKALAREAAACEVVPFSKDVFQVFRDDLVLLRGGRGALVANYPPYGLVESGVEGVAVASSGRRALLWQPKRLGLLEFPEPAADGAIPAASPSLRWLLEGQERLAQAFWAVEESHVIVQDRNQAILVSLDPDELAPVRPLASVKPGSRIVYSEESGALYYLAQEDGALMALQLVE